MRCLSRLSSWSSVRFLVLVDVAGTEARAGTARRELFALDVVSDFEHCHPAVLCSRTNVWRAQPAYHCRILALVGGAPLGGRILRSLRNSSNRVPAYPPETAFDLDCYARRAVLDRYIPIGRHHRNLPSPL